MFSGYRDLQVFRRAYGLALDVFEVSKAFPRDERFSLTDQVRRSSRSVAANLAEGYRKRRYPNMMLMRFTDADAEATETQVWLSFARDFGYLRQVQTEGLLSRYDELGRMIGAILKDPSRFGAGT